jgi:hypothetical protein
VRRKEAEVHTQLDPLATAEQFSDHWIWSIVDPNDWQVFSFCNDVYFKYPNLRQWSVSYITEKDTQQHCSA